MSDTGIEDTANTIEADCRDSTGSVNGLGLKAQDELIRGFAEGTHFTIVREFVEFETGKNSNSTKPRKATVEAKRFKASLIIPNSTGSTEVK